MEQIALVSRAHREARGKARPDLRLPGKNTGQTKGILSCLRERDASAAGQALAVVLKASPPLVDVFDFIRWKARTHEDGEAHGRIIASDSVDTG